MEHTRNVVREKPLIISKAQMGDNGRTNTAAAGAGGVISFLLWLPLLSPPLHAPLPQGSLIDYWLEPSQLVLPSELPQPVTTPLHIVLYTTHPLTASTKMPKPAHGRRHMPYAPNTNIIIIIIIYPPANAIYSELKTSLPYLSAKKSASSKIAEILA